MIYTVNKTKDVYTILAELAVQAEKDLDIFIPSGSLLLEDKLNLEFLAKSLDKLGKSVRFDTDDANGKELLENLNLATSDFGSTYGVTEPAKRLSRGFFLKLKFLVLNIFSVFKKLPKLKKPTIPLKINFILLGALVMVFAGLIYGAHRYISSQKAYIKIYTKSELLARSITIRVDSHSSTDVDKKILEGTDISTSIFETKEIETTGEKEEGDYAEGKIVIYNRTEEEFKLEKGEELFYEKDDEKFGFKLKDAITVPPLTYEIIGDPASTMIPGEIEASVKALEFGDAHNIGKGKTLKFDDYDESDLVAKSNEDFKGGETKIVQIVSEEDIEKLKEVIKRALEEQADQALSGVVPSGYTLVKGSLITNLGDFEINAEVGDEKDKISIKQSLTVFGLTYSEKKLDQLIMRVVGEYVPDEYALSGTKHTLSVEVLGTTEDTVLSNSAADLQVTVKTSVIPDIDIGSLKKDLRGLSLKDLQKKLGSMNSIKTYEFNLSPPVPFKTVVPNDVERILIEILEAEDD